MNPMTPLQALGLTVSKKMKRLIQISHSRNIDRKMNEM